MIDSSVALVLMSRRMEFKKRREELGGVYCGGMGVGLDRNENNNYCIVKL